MSIDHILICGSGLAAHMAAAALSRRLPEPLQITLLEVDDVSSEDLFYGTVSGPGAYDFNLSAGLSEPSLVVESETAFSWGTKYEHWAGEERSWIQCFQLPLPVIDGVLFHHHLAKHGVAQLERFLVAAAAARKGTFAHPPREPGQQSQHLLSRAEYGYQFDPMSYARLFASATDKRRVRTISSGIKDIEIADFGIVGIHLDDGRSLNADLYVDCTGPNARLLSCFGETRATERALRAAQSNSPASKLGPPVRTITRHDYGWRAETPLRGSVNRPTVYDPGMEAEALSGHGVSPERTVEVALGMRRDAWSGNCVGIGHSAYVVEPLTPAPLMLLERDITRLISLIPLSSDMGIERREYCRRCNEDFEHAQLFTRALFETEDPADTHYWRSARQDPVSEKLERKFALFRSRGFLVAYDLEPFNAEDWAILHYGMGRRPVRYDRFADRTASGKVREYLASFERDIKNVAERMPSHATYMAELTRYLAQNKG